MCEQPGDGTLQSLVMVRFQGQSGPAVRLVLANSTTAKAASNIRNYRRLRWRLRGKQGSFIKINQLNTKGRAKTGRPAKPSTQWITFKASGLSLETSSRCFTVSLSTRRRDDSGISGKLDGGWYSRTLDRGSSPCGDRRGTAMLLAQRIFLWWVRCPRRNGPSAAPLPGCEQRRRRHSPIVLC